MHLPLSPPPPLLAYMEGDLVTEGRLHRLTRSTAHASRVRSQRRYCWNAGRGGYVERFAIKSGL